MRPRDRSVDRELAGQLVAPGFEVLEADPAVVESGVQIGELRQDRRLIDLGSRCRSLTLIGCLLVGVGAVLPPLLFGLGFGLLVAVSLELAEGRSPP
jgi:hypothetical protein